MISKITQEKRFINTCLRATPGGQYYLVYPDAGNQISLNMSESEVHEHCRREWPQCYSAAAVDRCLQAARMRLG
jgi:hypothetical protein